MARASATSRHPRSRRSIPPSGRCFCGVLAAALQQRRLERCAALGGSLRLVVGDPARYRERLSERRRAFASGGRLSPDLGGRDGEEDFASFRARSADAGFSDWLRAENQATWGAMVGHRSVSTWRATSCRSRRSCVTLRYEHGFVRAAIGIVAYALAKAPTAADQDHLIGVLGPRGRAGRLLSPDIRAARARSRARRPDALPQAARGLREGVLAIAAEGGYAEILAAMLAAEWMYLTWCEAAHARGARRAAPADWIRLHIEPAFAVRSRG